MSIFIQSYLPDNHCIYTDTDSVFFSALPLIKHRYPDIDTNDAKLMSVGNDTIIGVEAIKFFFNSIQTDSIVNVELKKSTLVRLH